MNEKGVRADYYEQLFPGRYLKAADLRDQDRTLIIADVTLENLPTDDGEDERRGVISFSGEAKQLVLNRTNGEALKAMFTASVKTWPGKRVTLYPTTTRFGKETVPCIRVRGSPDLAADVSFELKLPKKKAQTVKLTRTGNGAPNIASGVASEAKAASHWPTVKALFLAAGYEKPEEILARVTEWTGKAKREDLTAEDVAKVKAALVPPEPGSEG